MYRGIIGLVDGEPDELAGQFISDVLLPYCSIPDDEQDTLGGGGS